MILYMYIASAWSDNPSGPGDKILISTETSCLFGHLLQFEKIKKISLKSEFIHISLMILYMYIAPLQGQTTPWEKILMSI